MHTAIVTDSTADVPEEIAEKLNISVIPAILMFGEDSFEDGKGITRQEFYERLPDMNPLPTTGTPSAGAFDAVYSSLLNKGIKQVLSIHVADNLSGIYGTAKLASKNFGDRVTVIDSESLSMGIGFQVIAAAEFAAQNQATKEIFRIIEETRRKTRLIAMLDTLEFVHRSGRVGWARARIGSLLRVKPFLEVKNGQVFSLGQTRTRKKGIANLQKYLLSYGPLERIAILHTNAESDAINFMKDVVQNQNLNPLIINVTTIIGTHVGPKGLGFAAVLK